MRFLTIGVAAAALAACGQPATDPDVQEVDEAKIGAEAEAAEEAEPTYGDTAFEFTEADGTISTVTHDSSGAYMITGAGEMRDRGNWEYVDGKLCYDSEILEEDPGCFEAPSQLVKVGDSYQSANADGEMIDIKRVDYRLPAREAPE